MLLARLGPYLLWAGLNLWGYVDAGGVVSVALAAGLSAAVAIPLARLDSHTVSALAMAVQAALSTGLLLFSVRPPAC